MLVVMVDKAIEEFNNPRISEFFDLRFCENMEDICNYISMETENGYYVRGIWSIYLRSKLPLSVIYHLNKVKVSHVTIQNKERVLFRIEPNPKNEHRRWVVHRLKQIN